MVLLNRLSLRNKNSGYNAIYRTFAFLVALLIFGTGMCTASIYVPDDYLKIQSAVDNATAGDTIIVRDGVYIENVDVDKSLSVVSENGTANCTIQAAFSLNSVFDIKADHVNISGFTVSGGIAGIFITFGTDYCNISNNNATDNWYGISLKSASGNVLTNNTLTSNNFDGIKLYNSSGNIITKNNASDNYYGISLNSSSSNTLDNNTVLSNKMDGIRLESSSSDNTLTNNTISNPLYGIRVNSSSNNRIFLNNFIDNGVSFYSSNSSNIWNSTEQITYTFDGKPFTGYMGNYWSDYSGSDSNNDGIGDTPYSVGSDYDNFPLMQSFENYFGSQAPSVIYVPDDHAKIQWAVGNATAGDTIIVRDGVYIENVDVDKSLSVVSENGTANCTIQAADHGHAFNVSADRVTITGFTVKDAMAGIYIQADNCNITKNICLNNDYGIPLMYSNNNSITDNYISLNNYNGIYLYISSSNTIVNNTVFLNNNSGIYVDESFNNIIYGNNVSSNNESGILVEFSINNTVEANSVTLNDGDGIEVHFSNNTRVMDNTIHKSEWSGIDIWMSHNNSISGNNVSSSDYKGISVGMSSNNEFSVNNVSGSHYDGIDVSRSHNNSFIKNNIFSNNWDGIELDDSENNLITNNTFFENDYGVLFGSSSSNTVKNNTAVNNTHGICILSYSNNNLISGNNVSLNSFYGIYLSWSSNYNTIVDNEILNNKRGIQFNFSCMYNTISRNNIFSNNYGIYFYKSTSNNEITDNNVLNNKIGVRLWNTTGNVFTRNYIGNNTNYSFYIESSDIQVYLNNFFDNENSVYSDSNSWWNSTEMLIYEFNGSMFRNHLGNYWSDYNGSDSDSDGVGDVPYNVNTSIPEKDFYPLTHFMENFTPISIPDLTVGDITIPKMEPGKNSVITVMISNTGTGNATTNVSLKVENNTIENKTLQLNAGQAINLTFNWIPPGSGAYSIEVEVDPDDSVSEFNETNNNVSTIVTVSSPPSGSSQPASGGGGGGGGALTLKPSFIAPYEYYESFVRSFRVNETVVIVIPAKLEEDTGISEIGASIDKIMLGTAAISKVRSLPEDMPAPEGNVFAYFEFVCTQYGTLNKVEPSGYLKFRVLKEWLRSVEAGQSDVKLLKYADKWIEIPVELTGEDENYHYFKANLESFSIFSIVAEVKAVTITPTSTPMQVKTEAPEPIETLESLSTEITTPAPAFSTEMIVTIAVIMSATAVLLYVARRK